MAQPTVLFVCVHNAGRSQMAAGLLSYHGAGRVAVHSAGSAPGDRVNPSAVEVMREVGVDISEQRSKAVEELLDLELDYVVTVCDGAHESCPVFPGRARIVHRGFEDPPKLAEAAASEEEAMSHYRRIRDQIRELVESLPDSVALEDAAQ